MAASFEFRSPKPFLEGLRQAARRAAGHDFFPDGMTVRITPRNFKPDALVDCPSPPLDAIEIHGVKLDGYFSLPSASAISFSTRTAA
jgi:hypothetical protein